MNLSSDFEKDNLFYFKYAFDDKFMDKLISRMDQNQDVFEKIVGNEMSGSVVREFIMNRLYKRFNE